MSDTELLENFKNNDDAAWKKVYLKFYRLVRYLINKRVSDPSDVDELSNDVFIKIKDNCHNVNTMENLKALLFVATRQVVIDHFRKLNNRKLIKPEEYESVIQELNDPQINQYYQEQAEEMDLILNEINKQPQKRRDVFLLIQEGYSIKEIAEKLKISISTVHSHKDAVLRDLKEKLGPKLKKYGIPIIIGIILKALFW